MNPTSYQNRVYVSIECNFLFFPETPELEVAVLIASEAFGQPITPELRTDVFERLARKDLIFSIVEKSKGELIGFATFMVFGDTLYLDGIVIRPEYHKRGLSKQTIQLARKQTSTDWLVLCTQSVRMWSAGRKVTSTWYPLPNKMNDTELEQKARSLMVTLGMKDLVDKGFYGGKLYDQKPTHRNIALQSWWDTICSFERGDAVLCLGRF